MNKLKLTAILLVFSVVCNAQEIMIEGRQVAFSSIEVLDAPCSVLVNCQGMEPGSIMQFFRDYFNVSSLSAYQEFFKSEDWFGLDQPGFDQWKEYIKENPLVADAYFVFTLEGKTFGSVSHYIQQGQYRARQNFLCQKEGGKWIPLTSRMDEDLAMVSHYISLINVPKFKNYTAANESLIAQENHQRLTDKDIKNLLLAEIEKLTPNPSDDAQLEKELRAYLTKLELPDGTADEVVGLIRELKFAEAVGVINLSNNKEHLQEISDQVRKIYGDQLLPTPKVSNK